jgi:hypothetical protein
LSKVHKKILVCSHIYCKQNSNSSLKVQISQFHNFIHAKVLLSTHNFLGAAKEKAVSLSQVMVENGFLQIEVPLAHLLVRSVAEFQQGSQLRQ